MKKKVLSLIFTLMFISTLIAPAYAASSTSLTWDAKPASLSDIAKNTGYDMVDTNGNYKPLYTYYAVELWNNGLFLGSDGSFDLDKPITRAEGVVMTIRILGKEAEARATPVDITFTDVPDWASPYVTYAVQKGITSGYSTTTFGSSDAMTATQFLTFVLRAMGYKDGEDFTWDKAYDKALDIGLIGVPCHTQYSRSNLFLRDNAAVICYNALFKTPAKSGGLLKDTVIMPGKPMGSVPEATRTETPSSGKQKDSVLIEITNVIVGRPYVADGGLTEKGEILVDFTVVSGTGTLNYSITGHSGSSTNFSIDVEEGVNYRIARKYRLSHPFTEGASTFVLTWDGGGVTKTIRVGNTNMHSTLELIY